jgi:hypothetical protein
MIGGVFGFDVGELLFLVDVDEDAAFEGFPEAAALDLAGLEDDVAVGEDDGSAPLADVLDDIEREWVEARGEGVIDEEAGELEELHVVGVFDAVALQCAEVVGVS